MMINKRLIHMVDESMRFIKKNVAFQWFSMLCNVVFTVCMAYLLEQLWRGSRSNRQWLIAAVVMIAMVIIRFICIKQSAKMSYNASKTVKRELRKRIYEKLAIIGSQYHTKVQTSEILQVCVEGVEQLEIYFAAYLPQFFYAMLAPLTLFIILCFVYVPAAVVLLICVPFIPGSIMMVQKFAKRLLRKYWGQYTALGEHFLENIQGLTTLKVYQADEEKHREMNQDAELFRRITMKVLTMQLNSITIMDLVAYGGAALGVIMALQALRSNEVGIMGAAIIVLLAAEFFIPMRQLGSYFHVAMNGMAASEKIFNILDLKEPDSGNELVSPKISKIKLSDVSFSYNGEKNVLSEINFEIERQGLYAFVGKSGCGKSTLAGLLMGRLKGNQGQIIINNQQLKEISEYCWMKRVTYIGHQPFLFKGTVKENLLMAQPQADDTALWQVLKQAEIDDFFRGQQGLLTKLTEQGNNLSGGQKQRLAIARALLHNSPIYIFDEATSNIDVESEEIIIGLIKKLAQEKIVICISHRLANVVWADQIYVMEQGQIVEGGDFQMLLQRDGSFNTLWTAQQELEKYREVDVNEAKK
jgi:ABC-type transport system involved in cytochrome bd biosynthesis fused ATPase/permease subunit